MIVEIIRSISVSEAQQIYHKSGKNNDEYKRNNNTGEGEGRGRDRKEQKRAARGKVAQKKGK